MAERQGNAKVPQELISESVDSAAKSQQPQAMLEGEGTAVPATVPRTATERTVADLRRQAVRKGTIRRIWAIGAAVITVITSVVSIWPILFKDESRAESLIITMKPFRPGVVSHFALPVGAPIDTFPSNGQLCTAEQEEWLQQHGVRFQRDYLVDLRNSAGGGSSLAVSNIRGVADSSTPVAAAYTVECDKQGDRGAVLEPARVLLDTGEGAFFDKSLMGPIGTGLPDSPLAYNLRPGETGQIVLTLSALSNFRGNLVASVAAGEDTSDATVKMDEEGPLQVPGVLSPRTILVTVEKGALHCNVVPNPSAQTTACDVRDLFHAD